MQKGGKGHARLVEPWKKENAERKKEERKNERKNNNDIERERGRKNMNFEQGKKKMQCAKWE